MGKYIGQWLGISLSVGFLLYTSISIVSNTTFYVLEVFEVLLMLVGSSTLMATVITCTKIIIDKINKALDRQPGAILGYVEDKD